MPRASEAGRSDENDPKETSLHCSKLRPRRCVTHSMTSSASCWRCMGTSRPIALAALRLMTSSNFGRTDASGDRRSTREARSMAAEATRRREEGFGSTRGVCGQISAAIERKDENGEITIELPKMRELLASAAVLSCLMPIRLRGPEMKAMRKIMRLTLTDLAKKLDDRTAAETVSRWESEAQPMGGYVEKLLRLLICETLKEEAPGIEYNGSMIANLRVLDPWRADMDYKVPTIVLVFVKIRQQSGPVIEAWAA
jgi:DNA-binding transcriptional regulator YiaG